MPTSRDVARLAGVSQATVSRTLSSPDSVATETRVKVMAAAASLGYSPHSGARAMKTRRSNTVGVVVADLSNPFYTELLGELVEALERVEQKVVIWSSASSNHTAALESISTSAIDGLIFTTATSSSVELAAAVDRRRPVVLVNREVEGLDSDRIVSDNYAGAAAVADFFVGNGRTDVAFIGGLPEAKTAQDRSRGFVDRMAELGHPLPEHLVAEASFSHDAAAHVADKLLGRLPRPSAIFCANDFMAFGALDTRVRRALPPEECWVVGYDDVAMASWETLDLTTVRQPIREMAAVAVEMLMDRVNDPALPPRRRSFQPTLLVRGSTPLAS
ncbi:LacI family DNA-binding transcriptional regulator [Microbacterium karelineae]|uniref:LacI family DNA-binding transcriptional regulator n=1 Tax=Microbacterium karelineae TaxID=2654283 RepID=UPI0012EAF986|nr:LacI family DNA-binding transcriptional regulator [Microbacterium karelineae]